MQWKVPPERCVRLRVQLIDRLSSRGGLEIEMVRVIPAGVNAGIRVVMWSESRWRVSDEVWRRWVAEKPRELWRAM